MDNFLTLFTEKGVPAILLLAGIWFLYQSFWPFVTEKVWPTLQATSERRDSILRDLQIAVTKFEPALRELSEAIKDIKAVMSGMDHRFSSLSQDVSEQRVLISGLQDSMDANREAVEQFAQAVTEKVGKLERRIDVVEREIHE